MQVLDKSNPLTQTTENKRVMSKEYDIAPVKYESKTFVKGNPEKLKVLVERIKKIAEKEQSKPFNGALYCLFPQRHIAPPFRSW